MSDAAQRIRRVICDVVAEALRQSAAAGIVVLQDHTPEGELLYGWLVQALGEDRVWREGALASNVQGTGAAGDRLLAHPANRTALLLGGRPPAADLFPLGDVSAVQVLDLAGGWTAAPEIVALAAAAGGPALVDTALAQLTDGRERETAAVAGLPEAAATELLRLYQRGRFFRRYPRLVPKLGARTPGIDLFD